MPLVKSSSYQAPPYLLNPHLETIIPQVFRRINGLSFQRERFVTSDEDFLELDWLRHRRSDRLLILFHGLEGNSRRVYMKGMAQYFFSKGWDVLAWNCRSCGGSMNKNVKLYHHGEIEDFTELINYVLAKYEYKRISLVGFSMGGSIILKYLGKLGTSIPRAINSAVAISAPLNLKSSVIEIMKKGNRFYHNRFLKKIRQKVLQKSLKFPELRRYISEIRSFADLHEMYIVPVYGFKDENHYFEEASAVNFIKNIQIPTLILNAKNDPMLGPECYPYSLVSSLDQVFLEAPSRGGHVGFMMHRKSYTWAELRSWQFIKKHSFSVHHLSKQR